MKSGFSIVKYITAVSNASKGTTKNNAGLIACIIVQNVPKTKNKYNGIYLLCLANFILLKSTYIKIIT